MGSYASGRYRTRNRGAVEGTLQLDIRVLRRKGFVRPGQATSGTMTWSRNGRPQSSIRLTMDLVNPDAGLARLCYTVGGEDRSQTIVINSQPCRFGGRRFYFRCPHYHDRVLVLCFVHGHFASRDYHRLAYRSQSEDGLGRAHRARSKAEARVLGTDGNPRPRGHNRERLLTRWEDAEERLDAEIAYSAARLFALLPGAL